MADEKQAAPDGAEPGLLARINERTGALHLEAEKTGIVRALLRGTADRYGYALLLRNLLPAYERMEAALDERRDAPGIAPIADRALYRSEALVADLRQIHGEEWTCALPVLASADRYADRIAVAAAEDAGGLVAHAYVRYMGDLSGGQILKRLLSRTLGLPPAALGFYDFPAIADVDAFKAGYRDAVERAAAQFPRSGAIVDEAAEAFRLNIAVSLDVAAAATGTLSTG